ncbi:MAG: hypothetical protein LBG95_01545 [Treponema sp.]|jgi:hypothetical protein|nr:hypothetical protein [Treponema sp.]
MKTWKHFTFAAILAFFGITLTFFACDNGDGIKNITLSGTVNVILDNYPPDWVSIVVHKDQPFSDDTIIIGAWAELQSFETGKFSWSVTLQPFSSPVNLYIDTCIFCIDTEVYHSVSYFGKHKEIEVHRDNISSINLGTFNYLSIIGTVGNVTVDGITVARNDMYIDTYHSSTKKWLYGSRILDDGKWYAVVEPFEHQDNILFRLRFLEDDGNNDFYVDTGKTVPVFNSKVSVAIGDVTVTTREIQGTVTGGNIYSVLAFPSTITKNEFDNGLSDIKILGSTLNINGTLWKMKVDSTVPQYLWFWVRDTEGNRYITPNAVDTATGVNLDISKMTKIIDASSASWSVLPVSSIRKVYPPATIHGGSHW